MFSETSVGKVIIKKPTIRTSPRDCHYGSELTEDNHLYTSSDKQMARGSIRPGRTKTSDILPYEIFSLPFPYVSSIKLHGLSPQANYADRATASCRRS
jgi:hypothetical protein